MRRLALLLLAALSGAFLALPVPRPEAPRSAELLDREGRLLGATVAADEQWRMEREGPVPESFALALIEAEDRRFRWHPGVDPLALARALRDNLSQGRVVSGASTLSMQVVRLSRANPPRTLAEKMIEAALALRLELACTKDEILALYADNAPFGGNVVGLEAASWRLFGRAPEALSWAEAALLAVLPNDPGELHAGRNRPILRDKRDRLLHRLHQSGRLDAEELALALAEPLPERPVPVPQDAPHLLARARGRTRSTLDQDVQRATAEVLARHQARLAGGGVHGAAALVLDLASGETLAYVGNVPGGAAHGDQVDVVRAPRSTGSLLKPLLYAAMLEEGLLLPGQLVPDLPTRYGGFSPENFDRLHEGAVPADEALARSRNAPAVHELRTYGVARFAARLRRQGMSTLFRPADDYGLALIIGGAEGTLWELTGLYRDLGLSALHPDAALPPAARWRAGEAGPTRPAHTDAGAAWLTLQAMGELARPGERAAWRSFAGSAPIYWKTGTSWGFRDGWAIGLDGRRVIGVWVGNPSGEGRPELTGQLAAAPVLFDLFERLGPGAPIPAPDGQLIEVEVCAHSGLLAGPDCEQTRRARAPRAATGARGCTWCRPVLCLDDCQRRVDQSCPGVAGAEPRGWFSLPPAMEALYRRVHSEYRPLPPLAEGCAAAPESGLAILVPAQDAAVFVPVELDGARGRVVVEASAREPEAELHWHLDDQYLGSTRGAHQLAISPAAGAHVLTVVSSTGASVARRFEVVTRGG